MSEFEYKTLETIKKAELIDVFNSAFADYFVKIKLNENSFTDKLLAENIALENSVGAFWADKLVGFILVGIENENSYNGGTGVLQAFRGNHLTEKMYQFLLPKLKTEGIISQQLEVITQNHSAIKSYERIGFQKVRTLACLKGKISVSEINQNVEIKVLDEIYEKLFPTFWNSQPSWQNSLSAINRTKNQHKIIGAYYQNELVGYLIHTENGRIKQFAVKKQFRNLGIGQTLFSKFTEIEIIITNIDKDDVETINFLNKIGLDLFLEQFEMKFKT